MAAQRARLARSVRIDHRLPARLATRRQGRLQPRAERPDRGARPARLARLLRERLRAASRVLRRTRPGRQRIPMRRSATGIRRWSPPTTSAWRTNGAAIGWCGSARISRNDRAARRAGRHRPRDDGRRLSPSGHCSCARLLRISRLRDRTWPCLTTSPDPPLVSMDAVQAAAACSAAWRRCWRWRTRYRATTSCETRSSSVLDAINDVARLRALDPTNGGCGCCCPWSPRPSRGLIADGLVTDPRGFRAINDEDFGDWIVRHGAPSRRASTFRSCAACTTWCSATTTATRAVRAFGAGVADVSDRPGAVRATRARSSGR